MSILRMALAAFVVAGLTAAASAADKADTKKLLVGKWEATKVDEGGLPKGAIVEFTADGKLTVIAKKGDEKETIKGTYTVDGDSFTYKLKIGDDERSEKITISKISAKEMETENKEGKKITFTKVK